MLESCASVDSAFQQSFHLFSSKALRWQTEHFEHYYIYDPDERSMKVCSVSEQPKKKINLLQSCDFDVCFVKAQRLSMHNNSGRSRVKNVNYLVNA